MLTARQVYEIHADCSPAFGEKVLPSWDRLTWPERDGWQRTADELNARDRREQP